MAREQSLCLSGLSDGHILITNQCFEEAGHFLFTLLLKVRRSWSSRDWAQAGAYYLRDLLRTFFRSHTLVLTVTHMWSSGIASHQIPDFDIEFLCRQISCLFWGFPKPFPVHLISTIFIGQIGLEKAHNPLTIVAHAGLCQPFPSSALSGFAALRL